MTNTYETIADLLPLQKQLDDTILANCGKTREETFAQRVIALKCEFYEFLNEWKGFKYWSKKPPTKFTGTTEHFQACKEEKLLLEACDVLHFLLSLFYDCGKHDSKEFYRYVNLFLGKVRGFDRELYLIDMFEEKIKEFCDECEITELGYALYYFLKLCERFGITEQLLIAAYLQKNEVNHKRQESGY